ncbi:MAG: aldehyde ferredoxin oxidoreductase family protein [Deltaproteobacteria bacterium]|jgi:aldehyde:ferredoxin oxidoreductase|nr:aldehyde ferredoxin oxidoreductase family protein [Deltaproteobacteria bacterium]
MPDGYTGKILRIDLSTAGITVEEPAEELYRKYMGGSALGMYYLLNEMPAGADPLGPDNILALSLSVVTGAPVSGQSRMTATAKSPLSGGIGDSQCGGFWPAKLKFAGFDAIIIKGRASSPVYLWIDDGRAELKDASHIWGQTTGEAQAAIMRELGEDKGIEILQIGPAGEKLVRYACLINMCNRANGRTGMGAVMGSKNLKAIAVRGNNKPSIADPAAFKEVVQWGAKTFPGSGLSGFGKYGTAGSVGGQQATGGLPTRNFTSGVFDGWKGINGKTMYDTTLRGCKEGDQDRSGRDTCFGCIIRCKRIVAIEEGPFTVDPLYGGPEYETVATFGSYCGVDDLAAVCKANEICNAYGMDTISCGATIAWAMEAYEAGCLTQELAGGMQIKFGDAHTMVELTRMIGERRGFGDLLAEGSARVAAELGCGEQFLITGKKQEAPAHMPQVKKSLALIYAVNPFGADHMSSEHDPMVTEGAYDAFKDRFKAIGLNNPLPAQSLDAAKVEFACKTQQTYSMMDSLDLCHFVWGPSWQLYGFDDMVNMVKAVTGWDVTVEELQQVGERRLNMMRAFNAREQFTRHEDTLPEKFFDNPLEGGPSDGGNVDRAAFEKALTEYYRQCGWDAETGNPRRNTLTRLGLAWVADKLDQ